MLGQGAETPRRSAGITRAASTHPLAQLRHNLILSQDVLIDLLRHGDALAGGELAPDAHRRSGPHSPGPSAEGQSGPGTPGCFLVSLHLRLVRPCEFQTH